MHSISYIGQNNLSFSYWDVDGTESTAQGRTFGAPDGYGVFNTSWTGPASLRMLQLLQSIQPLSNGSWAQTCDIAQETYPGMFELFLPDVTLTALISRVDRRVPILPGQPDHQRRGVC